MKRRLLLDTNLLVLLIAGSVSPDVITRHRRLREYTVDDFLQLRSIVAGVRQLLSTPNILSETSNLASQIAELWRGRIAARLAALIGSQSANHEEIYVPSIEVIGY